MSIRTQAIRTTLKALHLTGAYRLLRPVSSGVGAILMLHRVRPAPPKGGFAPNGILEITPEFLDAAIGLVLEAGYEIVSLDEAKRRLLEKDFQRKFVCFTFDDGYSDNHSHAYPVFKRRGVPFAIYVATALPDGCAQLWWIQLEQAIASTSSLQLTISGEELSLATGSVREKYAAYQRVYWPVRNLNDKERESVLCRLMDRYHLDPIQICRDCAISWAQLKELSQDPMVTVGGHTANHLALRRLPREQARDEIEAGNGRLEDELGRRPQHFAFPFGDPGSAGPRDFELAQDLGFATAVTTRKGVLFAENGAYMHALPRVSLNGDYQSPSYLSVLLSGVPFALRRGFRRLDVA